MKKIFLNMILCCLSALSAMAQDSFTVIGGVVKDNATKSKLENVSVFVSGSHIGTVSNADGTFSLKIPAKYASGSVKAEHLGYFSSAVPIEEIRKNGGNVTIWLTPASKMLKEVTVYGGRPEDIVAQALKKIPENYSKERALFSAFYRETVQKGRRYIGVSEAMVDVFKTSYLRRNIAGERVQIKKGRRLISQNIRDTLSVKMIGGPVVPVALDFVKNGDFFLGEADLDNYEFSMEKPVSIDDRMQFAIRFYPKVQLEYALYQGVIYIDQKTLAFSKAELEMDVTDKDKAAYAILRKKPAGLRFKPLEMSYTITYKSVDDVSYINYVGTKIRFKCDWKRRLFSSDYTTVAETVMVDREDNSIKEISRKAAFGDNDIFYDTVDNYWDSDFWNEYNIIEPTESLERAVTKLKKRNNR